MELNRENIKERIEQTLLLKMNNKSIQFALDTVRKAYNGTLWIIGGTITDTAVESMYNNEIKIKDVDIMLKNSFDLDLIQTPKGWERKKTHFGNLRLIKEDEQIDVLCLESNYQFEHPGYNETIENHLLTVPLTIQSIAYNPDTGELFGDIGLESLLTKTVKINNLESAYKASSKRGHNIEYYLLMKSMKIGFIPDLSNLKEKVHEYFRKKKQYKYKQEENQDK